MFDTYCRIFERLGLDYRPVIADTGSIGGAVSHEFHVLADSGEDDIAFSDSSDYAANIEKAEALAPKGERPASSQILTRIDTPNVKTIAALSAFLNVDITSTVKTLLVVGKAVDGEQTPIIALVLRGDHQLNEIKAENLTQIAAPLTFASEEQILAAVNCNAGSIGPVAMTIPVIVDRSAAHLADFVCGANTDDVHLTGVNWDRDCSNYTIEDLRNVIEGDPSPCGQGRIVIKRGIEVGHIFQLGDKYAQLMKCGVLTEAGKNQILTMGCYGIGVSRIVAASIEQNHDKYGIKWPSAIAPFQVAIVPMNMAKSVRVKDTAEKIYAELQQAGIEVLFDDRKERPGVMFADHELIGTPYLLIIGERNLDNQEIEVKNRITGEKSMMAINSIMSLFEK